METLYRPELETTPFMLGRHCQSVYNAGDVVQGRGEDIEDQPKNGLTALGIEQAQTIYPAVRAAGLTVDYVNSSELLRARQTAKIFVDSYPSAKPGLVGMPVANLKEVSQLGREGVYTRPLATAMHQHALNQERSLLDTSGPDAELANYIGWIIPFGDGESPLQAALRGIGAIEEYGVRPYELIFSHGMLNRYMEAVATQISSGDRASLHNLLEHKAKLGGAAILGELRELKLPHFEVADDVRNRPAHGSVTQYTVDHTTGLWVSGRRIEPPAVSYVEKYRGSDGVWSD